MILIIDNYDSFTYNVVHLVQSLGYTIRVALHDQIDIAEIKQLNPSHIIISPGPCTPQEAGISNEVIQFFKNNIPILGICLGHQCIAEIFGGKVIRAPQVRHGKTSQIEHTGQSLFANIPSPFTATRYHSLIVEQQSLPDCLTISAWTNEHGQQIIMGLQHRELPIAGIQFHPEAILTEHGSQLLANFLASQTLVN